MTPREELRRTCESLIRARDRNVVNRECGHPSERFSAGVGCLSCHGERSIAEHYYERAVGPQTVLALLDENAALRAGLEGIAKISAKHEWMTHNEECDARNCDEDGDCRCADDVDGCADCGAKDIVHTTECSCGAWALRDAGDIARDALAADKGGAKP